MSTEGHFNSNAAETEHIRTQDTFVGATVLEADLHPSQGVQADGNCCSAGSDREEGQADYGNAAAAQDKGQDPVAGLSAARASKQNARAKKVAKAQKPKPDRIVEGPGLERWLVEESEAEELFRYTGQRNTPLMHGETIQLSDKSPQESLTPLQSVFKKKLRDVQVGISKNSRQSSDPNFSPLRPRPAPAALRGSHRTALQMAIDERAHPPAVLRTSLQESISALRALSNRSQPRSTPNRAGAAGGTNALCLGEDGDSELSRAAQAAINLMK